MVGPLAAAAIMGCVVLVLRSEIAHLGDAFQLLLATAAGTFAFAVGLACLVGRQFLDDLRSFRPAAKVEAPQHSVAPTAIEVLKGSA